MGSHAITIGSSEYVYNDSSHTQAHSYLFPAVAALTQDVGPGATVLDLGCGNGSFISLFRDRGWSLHGLDSSGTGIRQARTAFPGIQFTTADVTADLSSLPLAGQCDLIISTEVVEHVYLPRLLARNCWSLLKSGGSLIVSTPYHGYLKNLVLAGLGRMDTHFTALWDHGHIKFWSRRTLVALLEEAGLQVTGFRGCGRVPFLWKSMVVRALKPPHPQPGGSIVDHPVAAHLAMRGANAIQ
jgi:2-polyprenyl-6-hydroxyphenyl methylase/3-demethylubiquinone-9 3-methyltransferase